VGKIVLFLITAALFFHLANGVRHLIWDSGHGLDLRSANWGAVFVLAFAATATVGLWIVAALRGLV